MDKVCKVLVIDDSPFIFKAVKRALDNNKFIVVDNAPNGSIGIEMVERYKPDVITLDITMPVMDGLETAKVLLQKDPGEKIIMMSAMGDDDIIAQAKNIGVNHFLSKPFKKEELISAIHDLVKGA